MPDNPNSYLPQSAAALGQAPLAVIRPPQTSVNVPNPLDVTNFYRMQQGIQNNLGILQHNQQLQQAQKQLDLQNYQAMIEDSDKLLGINNEGFDSFYGDRKSNRPSGSSSGGGSPTDFLDFLDPTLPAQKALIDKWRGRYDENHDTNSKLGIAYIASGQRDPAQRAEVASRISRNNNSLYNDMKNDSELRKQYEIYQYYHTMLDQVDALKAKGYAVDNKAIHAMDQKFTDFGTGVDSTGRKVTSAPLRSDFDIQKYVYDPKTFLTNSAADADQLWKGYDIQVVQGDKIVTIHHFPTKDEIIQVLSDKYSQDRNAVGYFNNVIQGSTITDPSTGKEREVTFQDWIGTTVSAFTPIGSQTNITDIEQMKGTGKAETTATNTTGGHGPRPDGTYFDDKNESGQKANVLAESIAGGGFNIPQKDMYSIYTAAQDPEKYDIKTETVTQEDENGNTLDIPVVNIYSYNLDEKGHRILEDNPGRVIATFNKQQQPLNTTTESAASPKDTLNSRNNNPLNLRPTDDERKAGIPLGEGGFKKFNTMQEGFDAAIADVQSKIDGNSSAMQNSGYMKAKYTPEQLKNYQDVATVEDLINVWSPRSKYGGDNSDQVVDAYVQAIKDAGIDPSTKVSNLGDDQVKQLVLEMAKHEGIDGYNRLTQTQQNSTSTNNTTGTYNGRQISVTPLQPQPIKQESGVDW